MRDRPLDEKDNSYYFSLLFTCGEARLRIKQPWETSSRWSSSRSCCGSPSRCACQADSRYAKGSGYLAAL